MAKIHTLQTNFSSGALDPTMVMRTETGAYQSGARRLHNRILLNTGGTADRPGFDLKQILPGKARIRRFEFDEDEVYCFAFGHQNLRIYDGDGGLVEVHPGTPWGLDQVFALTFAALGDVMVVFHPNVRPQKITRTSLTSFTVTPFVFEISLDGSRDSQPQFKFEDDSITLTPSASTGSGVSITARDEAGAAFSLFDATWIGQRIRIRNSDVEITAITSASVAVGTIKARIKGELDPDPFRTTRGSTAVEVLHPLHGLTSGTSVTFNGANDVGGLTAANLNGARTITVINENIYSIVAGASATASADGGGPSVSIGAAGVPTRDWTEPAFSERRGWPSCGCFHNERFWIGGSPEIPAGLFASKARRYFSFDLGTASETDAIGILVGQDRLARIRHLVSETHLQIFTSSGEYYVPQLEGQALSPLNVRAAKQTPFGIGKVPPWSFDGATLFLQASGTAVREFIYNDQERKYSANALTIVSSHVLADPVDMAVVYGTGDRPEQYTYLVNADGTLATFHSARVERLAGWTTGGRDGKFISATTLDNALWVVAERAGIYTLEKATTAHRLDSALPVVNDGPGGVAPTVFWKISNAAYWGMKVWCVARRPGGTGDVCYSFGEIQSDGDGNLVLPVATDNLVAGFFAPWEIETLPPVIEDQSRGSLSGEIKRIVAANVRFHSAMVCEAEDEALVLRQVTDDMSDPPEALTGFAEFTFLGYEREPTLTLRGPEPLPCTILGLVLKVSA